MEQYTRFMKKDHGSSAWLKDRWIDGTGDKRISASVAAAIYNLHPFTTEAQLAAELLSDMPPEPVESNEAMERGNRLEQTLIDWANDKLGANFVVPDQMFAYKNLTNGANLVATLDGYDHETHRVLEVKTTTKEYDGEIPAHWYFQGIQQAICAEVNEITWAIFDRSQRLHIHTQVVSSDEKRKHIDAAGQWLSFINMGIAPDHIQWDYATMAKRFAIPTQDAVEVGPRAVELVKKLRHLQSEARSYEQLIDEVKSELAELIGSAEAATVNGDTLYTWKAQKRQSFDQKNFKLAYPDLAREFTKETTIRVMRMKGEK